MQTDNVANQELQSIFRSRVHVSFVRARICLRCARLAHGRRDTAEFQEWLHAARILRRAAAGWRKRLQGALPMLIGLMGLLNGCMKAPARDGPSQEVTANFEVQPSPDGRNIVWSLQFKSRAQYHALIESTVDGGERAKVRELIAAGMRLHHIVGCSVQEKTVTKLGSEGIAFVGSCGSNQAHATLAGGI